MHINTGNLITQHGINFSTFHFSFFLAWLLEIVCSKMHHLITNINGFTHIWLLKLYIKLHINKSTPKLKRSSDSFMALTFIMSIIPKKFGSDISESGARKFVLHKHEPEERVFIQYRKKSAGSVERSKDWQHKFLEIFIQEMFPQKIFPFFSISRCIFQNIFRDLS